MFPLPTVLTLPKVAVFVSLQSQYDVFKCVILPTNRDLADYLVFVYLGDDSVVAFDFVGHALEVIVI